MHSSILYIIPCPSNAHDTANLLALTYTTHIVRLMISLGDHINQIWKTDCQERYTDVAKRRVHVQPAKHYSVVSYLYCESWYCMSFHIITVEQYTTVYEQAGSVQCLYKILYGGGKVIVDSSDWSLAFSYNLIQIRYYFSLLLIGRNLR